MRGLGCLPFVRRAWTALVLLAVLTGCASVPGEGRLMSLEQGEVRLTERAACGTGLTRSPAAGSAGTAGPALAAGPIRVLSWNLYKGQAEGWQGDLARHALEHDLLLLQESVLTSEVRTVLEAAGHRWQMAAAFGMGGVERGVMLSARVPPASVCTLRTFEPLWPLPKTAMVARYPLLGRADALLVANLHGVNFELGATRFRSQIEALAAELAAHTGPLVLAGDFNAWNAARHDALLEVAQRLGLSEVRFDPDHRRTAFGRPLDRFFVRGLVPRWAASPEVLSSDHNPLRVVLDVLP